MSEEEKLELAELQRAQAKIGAWRQELVNWRKEYTRAMTVINALMGTLGKRINEIKGGTSEIITDHAVLRYLERYTDTDIEAVKKYIRELPAEEKVVVSGNIVTVGHEIYAPNAEIKS